MRGRSGFTLLELLIALALTGLLTWLGFAFLFPAVRASFRGAAQVGVQQEAVLSLVRLVQDLERTTAGGISLSTSVDRVLLAVNRLEDVQGDATQLWELGFSVYAWDRSTGRLTRREWSARDNPDPDPAAIGVTMGLGKPTRVTPEQLAALAAPRGSLLAQDVVRFEIRHQGSSDLTLAGPLELEIELVREDARSRAGPHKLCLQRTLALRSLR
ncbi:MAG: prepilin-type N-terminal cleavage/methylation domain-containing protein [Armatimonadetes bacterium]|nr:prepilin-type N-terminal cleavage/methylation domain-containing protein [Armatimonadota bacterium]